jgi:hypothetical protein
LSSRKKRTARSVNYCCSGSSRWRRIGNEISRSLNNHGLVCRRLTAGASAVQVAAQVDTSRPIYANSPFAYSIVVANGSEPEKVDLAPLKAYNPAGPSTQNQTSIVNGKTSSYVIMTYQLTAPAAGQHTLGAVSVTVAGRTYQTQPVTITVVEPGTTQQMDVEMDISTEACYVGQPVVLTFTFYVWADIVRSRMIDNINISVFRRSKATCSLSKRPTTRPRSSWLNCSSTAAPRRLCRTRSATRALTVSACGFPRC